VRGKIDRIIADGCLFGIVTTTILSSFLFIHGIIDPILILQNGGGQERCPKGFSHTSSEWVLPFTPFYNATSCRRDDII
jgi:hypothetical protein